jgi:hypothetical protein
MGKHGLGQRAAIFLKAAELIAGPYRRINCNNDCNLKIHQRN